MEYQKYLKYLILALSFVIFFFANLLSPRTRDPLGMPLVSGTYELYLSKTLFFVAVIGLIVFIVLLVEDIRASQKKTNN